MKKCALITNGYYLGASTAHQLDSLKREFTDKGIYADVIKGNTLLAYVNGETAHTTLNEYDFAIYLNKDVHTAKMLEICGLRLFNSAKAIELCDDKMLTYISLCNTGIRMPLTVSSPIMYRDTDEDNFADEIEKTIGYPVVIKEVFGSMGSGVHLAEDRESLLSTRKKLRLYPHLYQPFTGKGGVDKRIIVIGGKVFAAMQRVNENDFRSNIELGGKGFTTELTDEEVFIAEEASATLRLDYCGIDILTGLDGKPYFCEANSNAFFKGIENVTGLNVAKTYVEHIIKTVYGKI